MKGAFLKSVRKLKREIKNMEPGEVLAAPIVNMGHVKEIRCMLGMKGWDDFSVLSSDGVCVVRRYEDDRYTRRFTRA